MKSTKYNFLIALALLFASTVSYSQENKNVGIGTDNPQTTLDIRGDLKLTPETYKSGSASQLYWLNDHNEVEPGNHEILKRGLSSDDSGKYFYSFDVVIPVTEWRPDIYNFNTNIPAKDYIVTIINSNLLQNLDNTPVAVSHVDTDLSNSPNIKGNPIKQVDCWVADDGNWHISATYKSSWYITADNKKGAKWVISLFAIDSKKGKIVDPNPNYLPDDVAPKTIGYDDPKKAKTDEDQTGRHYQKYDESNPQNPHSGQPQSLRGDSFKLNSSMIGGANVDPLRAYENN